MMRARAATAQDMAHLSEALGVPLTPQARGIAAVDAQGRTRGCVVYDNGTPNSVQAHMAVDTPVAWRALLPHVFTFPFVTARRGVLLGIIPGDNARSLRMALRLGFRQTHRVRDGQAPGVDLVVHEMRRDECRWLET